MGEQSAVARQAIVDPASDGSAQRWEVINGEGQQHPGTTVGQMAGMALAGAQAAEHGAAHAEEGEYRPMLTELGLEYADDIGGVAGIVIQKMLLAAGTLKTKKQWAEQVSEGEDNHNSLGRQRAVEWAFNKGNKHPVLRAHLVREKREGSLGYFFGVTEIPGTSEVVWVPTHPAPEAAAPLEAEVTRTTPGTVATAAAFSSREWTGRPRTLDQFDRQPEAADKNEPPVQRLDVAMSSEFARALQTGELKVHVLNDAGLQVAEFEGEKHVFVGDERIPLPKTTINILQVVSQWNFGVTKDRLPEVIEKLVSHRVMWKGLEPHLLLLQAQLGSDHFRILEQGNNFATRRTVFKVEGALPRKQDTGISVALSQYS